MVLALLVRYKMLRIILSYVLSRSIAAIILQMQSPTPLLPPKGGWVGGSGGEGSEAAGSPPG